MLLFNIAVFLFNKREKENKCYIYSSFIETFYSRQSDSFYLHYLKTTYKILTKVM